MDLKGLPTHLRTNTFIFYKERITMRKKTQKSNCIILYCLYAECTLGRMWISNGIGS